MEPLRPATEQEVAGIADFADLGPGCSVWALDTPQGVILGVVRQAWELDPVFFPPNLQDRWKVVFARDVANGLLMVGVPQFYFQVDASDKTWQQIVEKWGAETVSAAPEMRYKKVLLKGVPNVNKARN